MMIDGGGNVSRISIISDKQRDGPLHLCFRRACDDSEGRSLPSLDLTEASGGSEGSVELMARGGGSGSVREDGVEGDAVAKEDERSWRREAEAVGDERSEWYGGIPFCPIRDVLLF
nr:hypothetical protein Itr_chr08CG14170 [Ipomoea trifida]